MSSEMRRQTLLRSHRERKTEAQGRRGVPLGVGVCVTCATKIYYEDADLHIKVVLPPPPLSTFGNMQMFGHTKRMAENPTQIIWGRDRKPPNMAVPDPGTVPPIQNIHADHHRGQRSGKSTPGHRAGYSYSTAPRPAIGKLGYPGRVLYGSNSASATDLD